MLAGLPSHVYTVTDPRIFGASVMKGKAYTTEKQTNLLVALTLYLHTARLHPLRENKTSILIIFEALIQRIRWLKIKMSMA